MNINWYPGHMKKTKNLLSENLKFVDLIIEVVDARIPFSSKNPDFDVFFKDKRRLIVLNKSDLANESSNLKWQEYYKSLGYNVILYNSLDNRNIKKLENTIKNSAKDLLDRYAKKGIKNKTIKAMIVGIPNTGKSTLINSLAKRKSARTGNKPGITTGKQWIKLINNIDLLDTPGILWPKISNKQAALYLSFTGAIRDEVIDLEEIAIELVKKLNNLDENIIKNIYNVDISADTIEIIDNIAIKRGCVLKGKEIDYLRVSRLILFDFRSGKLGKFTLDDIDMVKKC